MCVQCTSSNATACTASQACIQDACAAADAGGSSSEISTVIAYAVDGGTTSGLDLEVNGPLVTSIKPSLGSTDPGGFFVQAEQTGPALFVNSSPGTVQVGDRVSFTVSSVGQRALLPVATQIANLQILETGHDVRPLATNVSGVDFTNSANIDPLQSRLVTIDATVASVSAANTGYDQAPITSAGVPTANSAAFDFYAPTTVISDHGIRTGCDLHVGSGILWRYNFKAEPAVWNDIDVTVRNCPVISVTGAASLDANDVRVSFDHPIDASTISASTFSIDQGLSVLSATVDASGSSVTLATSTQSAGVLYTVTVASTVRDTSGDPLGNNSAHFQGFTSAEAVLRLTEIDPAMPSNGGLGGDVLELYAVSGGRVDGLNLFELVGSTYLSYFPAGLTVATGDVILVHLDASTTANNTCSESATKSDCPSWTYGNLYNDNAWDIVGVGTLAFSSKVIAVRASDGGILDAVPFTKPSVTAPGGFPTTVQSIESSGLWKPSGSGTCVDLASCENDAVNWSGATADATATVQHVATFGPTPDDKTAWTLAVSSWGSFPTGAPDSGTPDSGTPDSGTPDSGTPDSGTPDSGTPDSGTPDSGTPDAGSELKVGEWNIEWFGDPNNGPTDDNLQESNVTAVMADAGADVWGIEEVVDTARFANVVSALPGGYAAVVATDPVVANNSSYTGTQKVAVVYRTDEVTLNGAQIILGSDSYDFAGRPPLEVSLNVRGTPMYVIVVHMKAFSDEASWQRRQNASNELKSYLDTNRPFDRVMVLGDFNDDSDESISTAADGGTLPSPYANFVSDGSNYYFATTPLTQANTSTTATNFGNGPIDQHLITNELFGNLEAGSATVLHPNIPSYSSTTTDHYPTFVYYVW